MSNQIYENKLYNEHIKMLFLEEDSEKELSERSIIGYKRIFERANNLEERLKKDLYDFNMNEIERLVIKINPMTKSSAIHCINVINRYINWAIYKRLKNSLNPLDVFTVKELAEMLKNKIVVLYYTYDEINQFAKVAVNEQDKALIWALFFGIVGESLSEIRNLTIHDINVENCEVTLVNDEGGIRTIRLETEEQKLLINHLIKAFEQTHYHKKNGKTNAKNPIGLLVRNEHIFRPIVRGAAYKASYPVLKSRLAYLSTIAVKPSLSSPLTLRNSGMLFMGYQEYLAKGKLDLDAINKVCEHYNISKRKDKPSQFQSYQIRDTFLNEETIKQLYNI